MKKLLVVFVMVLLFTLTACNKSNSSPEKIGEIHFEMYFDILSDQEVDIEETCTLLYASDFVAYCENSMAEAKEMLKLRVLTSEDYELIDITSTLLDETKKEMRQLTDYEMVYEVTIKYSIALNIEDSTKMHEEEYTMFVTKIDGEFKAIQPMYK